GRWAMSRGFGSLCRVVPLGAGGSRVGVAWPGTPRLPSTTRNGTLPAAPPWPGRSTVRDRCTRSQEIAVINLPVIPPPRSAVAARPPDERGRPPDDGPG